MWLKIENWLNLEFGDYWLLTVDQSSIHSRASNASVVLKYTFLSRWLWFQFQNNAESSKSPAPSSSSHYSYYSDQYSIVTPTFWFPIHEQLLEKISVFLVYHRSGSHSHLRLLSNVRWTFTTASSSSLWNTGELSSKAVSCRRVDAILVN